MEEVAQTLGISMEVAAKKRIGRAVRRLREKLGVSEEQLAAGSLSVFFASQHTDSVAKPPHLSAKVIHGMTRGGTMVKAGVISKGVLKAMFRSSIKIPVAIATAAAIAIVASVYLVKQTATHNAPHR